MHYKEQRGRHELHIPVYFNHEKSDKNWSKLEGKICWQEKRSLALTVLEIQYGIFQACEKEGLKVEMCHSWSDCTTHRKKEVVFFILKGCFRLGLGPCLERDAEPQVISEGFCAYCVITARDFVVYIGCAIVKAMPLITYAYNSWMWKS